MKKRTFKEKVRAMKGSEILKAMLDGLKNPVTKIDMSTFGRVDSSYRICYGCAATNTICKIAKIEFTPENIYDRELAIGTDTAFLNDFEMAIDSLRQGDVEEYNSGAIDGGFMELPLPEDLGIVLPPIRTGNYQNEETIEPYRQYLKKVRAYEKSLEIVK